LLRIDVIKFTMLIYYIVCHYNASNVGIRRR